MSRSNRADTPRRSAKRDATLTERRATLAERILNPVRRRRPVIEACDLCGLPLDGSGFHMPGCFAGESVLAYRRHTQTIIVPAGYFI